MSRLVDPIGRQAVYEIHVFCGTATAKAGGKFPPGERHAFLLFLRQFRESDFDWAVAEDFMSTNGWDDPDFQQAGKVGPGSELEGVEDMYQGALSDGGSIIIYSDPL
jgi:hypothetical protein